MQFLLLYFISTWESCAFFPSSDGWRFLVIKVSKFWLELNIKLIGLLPPTFKVALFSLLINLPIINTQVGCLDGKRNTRQGKNFSHLSLSHYISSVAFSILWNVRSKNNVIDRRTSFNDFFFFFIFERQSLSGSISRDFSHISCLAVIDFSSSALLITSKKQPEYALPPKN